MKLEDLQPTSCFTCGRQLNGQYPALWLCIRCWDLSSKKMPKRIRRKARKGSEYYQQRLKERVTEAILDAQKLYEQRKVSQAAEHLQNFLAELSYRLPITVEQYEQAKDAAAKMLAKSSGLDAGKILAVWTLNHWPVTERVSMSDDSNLHQVLMRMLERALPDVYKSTSNTLKTK